MATGTVPSPWPVVAYDTAKYVLEVHVGVVAGKAKQSKALSFSREAQVLAKSGTVQNQASRKAS